MEFRNAVPGIKTATVFFLLFIGASAQNPLGSMVMTHNTPASGIGVAAVYTCSLTVTPFTSVTWTWSRVAANVDVALSFTVTDSDGSDGTLSSQSSFTVEDSTFDGTNVKCRAQDTSNSAYSKELMTPITFSTATIIPVGGSCPVTGSSCATLSSCVNQICSCFGGYTQFGSTCYRDSVVNLGGGCTIASECIATPTSCTNGVCVCSSGYSAGGNNCYQDSVVSLGGSCTISSQCSATSAACSNSNVCACVTGYTRSGTVCYQNQVVSLGQNCVITSQCAQTSTICSNSICTCQSGFTQSGSGCVAQTGLGTSCSSSATCSSTVLNSYCDGGVCRCNSGYYQNSNNGCSLPAGLGQACSPASGVSTSSACATANAECISGTCQCRSGYSNVGGTCTANSNSCSAQTTFGGTNNPDVRVGATCYSVLLHNTTSLVCSDTKAASFYSAVYWQKDGADISASTHRFIGGNIGTPTLTISNANSADAGNYYCTMCYGGTNGGCTTSAAVALTVIGTDLTSVSATATQTGDVAIGTALTMTCSSAPADSGTTYLWTYTGSNGQTTTVSATSQYTITSLTKDNTGTYTCQASLSNTLDSTPVTINVQYAPVHTVTGNTITYSALGTITCDITDANPSINTYVFYAENGTQIQTGTSNTYTVTEYQRYSCKAVNDIGDSNTLFLNVVQPAGDGAPSTGASTQETGLGTGELAAIILGIIFLILLVIIIVVCCCLYGVCRKKEKVEPQPEPVPQPVVKPYIPRSIVSAVSRKDVGLTVEKPESSVEYYEPSPRYDTPRYHLKPARDISNGAPGPIISVYDGKASEPMPHQLPALDTQYLYTEDAPKKHRRKRRKRSREHRETSPRKSYYEQPEPEIGHYASVHEPEDDDLVVIPDRRSNSNYFE